jgi:hypothetical protein
MALAGLACATACGDSSEPGGSSESPGGDSGASDGKAGDGSSNPRQNGGETGSSAAGEGGVATGGASANDGGGPALDPGDGTHQEIGADGGEITITNDAGDVTTTLVVPRGAVVDPIDVTIAPAQLPDGAPSSIDAVGTGLSIDFGGKTLTVPAKAKLRVAFDPADGDLVILVVTDSGTGFVKYTLEMDGDATYAVFDVVEGGRYLPVRLKNEPGCDETLPKTVTVTTQADLDKLAKVRRIVGDLRISGTNVTSLANLKCLLQIDGSLSLDHTNVTSLKGLDKLTFAGAEGTYYYGYSGVQLTSNSLLESASLPSVIAVGTRQANYYYESMFQVQANPVLAAFSADAIESAGLLFQSNGAAATSTAISMASLRKAQSVSITQNPSLKDLDGLAKLDAIVGDLTITNNGLANLDGLKSLTKVADLTLQNNAALTSAAGLSKLESAASISVTTNQLLKSLQFSALTSVTQATAYAASLTIQSNSSLNAFEADKLTSLAGSFSFQQNGNAAVSTGLSLASLKTVDGAVDIAQNLGAVSLDGLKALTSVGGDFSLTGNASLKTTAGLDSLALVKNLTISQNAKLTAVEGLEQLVQVDGTLTVSSNAALKTIAFPKVATLGGGLYVQSNAALTSFAMDGLRVAPATITLGQNGTSGVPTKLSMATLSSVAQQLYVSANDGLSTLDGFGSLLSVGATLQIQGNDALADVTSLTKLATISGALNISSNAALKNLTGLSALSRVTQGITVSSNTALADITLPLLTTTGSVNISSNAALASIKMDLLAASSGAFSIASNGTAVAVTTTTLSFAALGTIGQGFSLTGNPKLKTLTGFASLTGISGSFYVYNNVLLPNCTIVALRNKVQAAGAITGSITISNNLVDGCSTI